MKLSNETAAKLKAAKKGSKYYLTQTDEKNNYYVTLHAEDGTALKIPFKAMFFKEVSDKLGNIISISNSSTDCKSKELNLCQLRDPEAHCYGCRIEAQYCRDDIINSYESNLISGLMLTAANITYLSKYVNTVLKADYIRVNKHGDFINGQQLLKLLNLCSQCKNTVFYAYTARDDLFKEYNITSDFLKDAIPNLRVNGSNKKYTNRFKVTYSLKEYIQAKYICLGKCDKCRKCFTLKNKTIICLYHGSNKETVLNTPENRQFICDLLEALNVTDIDPEELTGGKLFDKLNKAYKHYYNINLKEFHQATTKEFIDHILQSIPELQSTGHPVNHQKLRDVLK